MTAERTIVGYSVEGCDSLFLFPDFQSAQDWRSAQIWDGGIGMTPEPEAVYAAPVEPKVEEESCIYCKTPKSQGQFHAGCGVCGAVHAYPSQMGEAPVGHNWHTRPPCVDAEGKPCGHCQHCLMGNAQ